MTNVIKEIFEEQIRHFKDSFNVASRALHTMDDGSLRQPAEFGWLREKLCADLISKFLPKDLSVGDGFLVNPKGEVSTQIDLVVTSNAHTPQLQGSANQSFYPVETVVGIGEVKSRLDKNSLIVAVRKLSKAKSLRENGGLASVRRQPNKFDANRKDWETNPYDQIFAFLICEKFDFDPAILWQTPPRETLYGSEIANRHRVNLILSVNDGLICWWDDEDQKVLPYPLMPKLKNNAIQNKELSLTFIRPDQN